MELETIAGPQMVADGQHSKARGGSYGELVTNVSNGHFFEQVMRGNGYAFSTALAGNALIAPGTANAPAIWNPPNSGRLLSIIKVTYSRVAVGTPLEGGFIYTRLKDVHSRKGTAADLVSGTAVAALNLRSDLGDDSKMVFFPTTIVTTSTPDIWAYAGVGQTADDGATTVSGPRAEQLTDHINGMLVVAPGTLFSIAAGVSFNTTYDITIYALSLPMPLIAR